MNIEGGSQEAWFSDPPARFRSLPFWAWNAALDTDEIAAQIRSMKEQGMGGFFMHSRDGLETPYMGEAWIDAVRTAIATAKEEGLSAWLYDEDRWPSGSSGGKVPARGIQFRAKALTIQLLEGDYLPRDAVEALFQATLDGSTCLHCRRLDPGSAWSAAPSTCFLVFRIEVAEPDEWFNGEAPPDNLEPGTAKAFLELNYQPYAEAVDAHFGKTVPGIFTDEPSVHDRHSRYTPGRGWIPWSLGFAGFFRERRGYDPYDSIPLVFFDGPGQARMRHDYWRTVTERFSENYSSQLASWCEAHDLAFTGHFLWENQLGTATRTGGAIMPHYRFQAVPGIDLLCEQIEETITVKQCTSVAHQYGRERTLSEMYGCVGWEFTFEGQKWLGDWQYVLGINTRSQHLALYSLKGCRKRDYPPVFNYNTNWWRHARIVEDYFARLGAALSLGQPVRELLVLHPASSAWCALGSAPQGFAAREQDRTLPEVNAYGDDFNRLIRAILGSHIDFDLGDEIILSEEGRIEGNSLRVKKAMYKTILLPPLLSMLRSTFELLCTFLDAGGRIVAVAPVATMLEGLPSADLACIYGHRNTILVKEPALAPGALDSVLQRRLRLCNRYLVEDPELLAMQRRVDIEGSGSAYSILFVVNTDRDRSHEILVEVAGESEVEELDALTGNIRPVEARSDSGWTGFHAIFGPAGSRLYRLRPPESEGAAVFTAASSAATAAASAGKNAMEVGASGFDTEPAQHAVGSGSNGSTVDVTPWGGLKKSEGPAFLPTPNFLVREPILGGLGPVASFRRTAPNALVLDRCSYELNGGGWSTEMEVWQAQSQIREALGMRQIYYNGLAQRYLWVDGGHPSDGAAAGFRFRFEVKEVPQTEVYLVLEEPAAYSIQLNGQAVDSRPSGWFLDRSFEKILLPPLCQGWNELILSCGYRNSMEVEDIFLLGDFAMDTERAIIAEPARLRFGDWCLQGYPHYCGSMVYSFDLELPEGPLVLHAGDFSAVTIEVRLNGEVAGQIPWRSAPGIDLSALRRDGINHLEIEAVGSPRNLLGPFHLARGKVHFNEWSAFRPEGAEYCPGYVLQPYGIFGQILLKRQ